VLRSNQAGLAQAGSTTPGKVPYMHSLTNRYARRSVLAALMAAALLLASVAPAFAQSSTQGGYFDEGGQVQEQVQGTPGAASNNGGGGSGGGETGSQTTTTTSGSGDRTLPFTGVEVGLMLAAGLTLAGLGLGLRRVTRQSAV